MAREPGVHVSVPPAVATDLAVQLRSVSEQVQMHKRYHVPNLVQTQARMHVQAWSGYGARGGFID